MTLRAAYAESTTPSCDVALRPASSCCSSSAQGPDSTHLARHSGLYAVTDVFRMTRDLLP